MELKPISRLENFLARIGGDTTVEPIEPLSRFEKFLDQIAGNVEHTSQQIPAKLIFRTDSTGTTISCDQTPEEIFNALTSHDTVECVISWRPGASHLTQMNVLKLPNVHTVAQSNGTRLTYVVNAEGFRPTTDSDDNFCWRRYFVRLSCSRGPLGDIDAEMEFDNKQLVYPTHSPEI